MNEEDPRHTHVDERTKQISVVRKEILSLPPEKALGRILEAPEPKTLVQSFPADELYYLVHDIGPADALPLLSLASDEQWEFILDFGIWEKHQINVQSLTRWLNLLMTADSLRTVKWFNEKKRELLALFLHRNIEVKIRETDQDPSELGEGFFTVDDVYYIRILDIPEYPEADDATVKERETVIKSFLNRLADLDHITYQQTLLESCDVIPAETEEDAYRTRSIRLAEKGFLPFEEAVGVYQSLTKTDLFKTSKKYSAKEPEGNQTLPIPVILTDILDGENLFAFALRQIGSVTVSHQLQSEFAALCNQIIVADQKRIQSKNELRPMVNKASGYLHMGLEELTGEKGEQKPHHLVELIQGYPLSLIFRIGYGLALSLKWKAETWRKASWFENQKLPLSFWGEDWLGVLGGLLIKRPLFFDKYRSGDLYREFASKQDIHDTAVVLEDIIAFDHLLSLMSLDTAHRPERFLTYKNLILTAWARKILGLSDTLNPIPLADFIKFNEMLFEPKEIVGPEQPRKTRNSMKAAFIEWIADGSGVDELELSRSRGKTLEALFSEIEGEYGSVSPKDLDPRHIHLFLVSR